MVNSLLGISKNNSSTHAVSSDFSMNIPKAISIHHRAMQEEKFSIAHDRSEDADQPISDTNGAFLFYAKPILTLMTQVQQSKNMPNIEKIHQQFIEEINHYIQELEQLQCSTFLIDCSAYCLCAAVDETVLATEWGTQSIWVQKSLLSMFRSETLGGERFYLIIERLCEETRKYIGVIELVYTILSLGFEGQYYGKQKEKRNLIKNQLYQLIHKERGKIIKQLSSHWSDVQTIESRFKRKVVVRRLGLFGISCLIILYVMYSFSLYRANAPVIDRLNKTALESPITAYSQLINRELFEHHLDEGESDA